MGSGRVGKRFGRGERRRVAVHEHHLGHVAQLVVGIFVEGEARGHAQQHVERDLAAHVVLPEPFGHDVLVVESKRSILDPQPDERVRPRLAHGPSDERHVCIETGRVAFGDDPTLVHDHEGARVPWVVGVRLREDRVHCMGRGPAVHAVRPVEVRAPGARRHAQSVRPLCVRSGWRRRTERIGIFGAKGIDRFMPDQRAAEPILENRGLTGESDAERRCPHGLAGLVDVRGEQCQGAESGTGQVLGHHVIEAAARDEQPRAKLLRHVAGAEQGDAVERRHGEERRHCNQDDRQGQ